MQLTTNFNLNEFSCKDGTPVPKELLHNVQDLAKNLQIIRDFLQEPVHINSAYRHEIYNKKIGGKPNSYHIKAMAADINCKSKTPKQLHTIIEKLITQGKLKQGGLGLYKGFVHYDVRGVKKRWFG